LPAGGEFFLNFVRDDTNAPNSTLDAARKTDGDDKIFGDLGNDWIVGGTGRDDMYGGMGNDLLNGDDDLSTNGNLNNAPDTSASYEDRAFGGAGRDVLIANTGGDRLIDWTGEYNSYLVPFSPFGAATISRAANPAIQQYLYDLSKADGADPTRAADTGADPPYVSVSVAAAGALRPTGCAGKIRGERDPCHIHVTRSRVDRQSRGVIALRAA